MKIQHQLFVVDVALLTVMFWIIVCNEIPAWVMMVTYLYGFWNYLYGKAAGRDFRSR